MPNYVQIIHRGRGYNVRVELPDGSTQLVSVDDLNQNWIQVPRNEGVEPYRRTRRARQTSSDNNDSTIDQTPEDRCFIRILHRGRGQHCRLLLPDGSTRLVNTEDLQNWTCVDEDGYAHPFPRPIARPSNHATNSNTNSNTRHFINPENQEDRIYVSVVRRGSRNTSVFLPNGERIQVPNEFMGTWIRQGSSAYNNWVEDTRYANGRTIHDITFGVELEFVADPYKYNAFCEAMRQAVGFDRFDDPMCYHIHSTTKWLLKTDASVRNTRSNVNLRGYELTSPILHWDDASKRELKKVLDVITSVFDGTVNKTCGTHIHVGNFARIERNVEFEEKVQNFQKNYGKHELAVFDRLTSPSRRGCENQYCRSCNASRLDLSSRYYKMNIRNIYGFGTLENRQHQGTLDLQKIWSWVELNGRYMVLYFKDPSQFSNNPYEITMEGFFSTIELSRESQSFFLAREAELN